MATNLKSLRANSITPVIVTAGVSSGVKITSVTYPNSATAALPAGGQTLIVTGSGFNSNAAIYVDSNTCSTTYVSSSSLSFTSPAKSVGTYHLYVYNTDGSAGVKPNGITFSTAPSWVTSSGALTQATANSSYSETVSATGDSTITYSLTSGTLPSGLSLNSANGQISGSTTSSTGTSTFTISATDSENQSTSRSFSINVVTGPVTVEYFMVAGGGAGGAAMNSAGGGGGAGGFVAANNFAATRGTTYTITIGAGGAGTSYATGASPSGSNTVFSTITAYGGGGGGNGVNGGGNKGANGGSGGGEGGGASLGVAKGIYPGSSYISATRQGYDGGATYGGGGGAGGAGTNGVGGVGGQGIQSSITGTASWYAAGGSSTSTTSVNDIGGRGDSGSYTGSTAGVVNTGSGGGAAWNGGSAAGKSGGSGVVILRFASADQPTNISGDVDQIVGPGYTVFKFTSSGTITF
jgi:hypothetical protein